MTMERKELMERYYILSPDWGSHTTVVLFRKDAKGFVHLNLKKGDDAPSISDLFVEPSARNKGIGQELLDAAEVLRRGRLRKVNRPGVGQMAGRRSRAKGSGFRPGSGI